MSANAEIPIPGLNYDTDAIIEEFRGPLRIEIENLSKNFISKVALNEVVYTSPSSVSCDSGQKVSRGRVLAKIEFYVNQAEDEMTETTRYTGCNDRLSLTEIVRTEGTALAPNTFDQVILGRRIYDLSPTETRRDIQYRDAFQKEIARVIVEKKGETLLTRVFILGKLALTSEDYKGTDFSQALYRFKSFPATLRHGNYLVEDDTTFPGNYYLKAQAFLDGNVKYSSQDSPDPLSLAIFQRKFANNVLGAVLDSTRDLFQSYLSDLPPTEYVSASVRETQAISDLRAIELRLLGGFDIATAKLLIRGLIDGVEKGRIKIEDNRGVTRATRFQ